MHNITEVLLKNHQIMPYKRKTDINNFGIVKNKSYTNSSKKYHKYRKMSPRQIFLLIISTIIIALCTSVNCNIIAANKNNYLMSSTKPWKSIDSYKNNLNSNKKNINNELTTRTTKDDYLKSLQEIFMSTLVNNKNNSSIKNNNKVSLIIINLWFIINFELKKILN